MVLTLAQPLTKRKAILARHHHIKDDQIDACRRVQNPSGSRRILGQLHVEI